jgi:maleylacetoacetate isomerase
MQQDTTPVLYDYWRSSASYRVRIALNYKGIDYRLASVNLLTGENRTGAHKSRNPQGLLPVLQQGGTQMTQSLAIIEYLDEEHPEPPLLPRESLGRQRVRALSYAIAMEIHPVCNLSVAAEVARLTGGGDEVKKSWMQHHIRNGLDGYEGMLNLFRTSGRFSFGDTPSMADCCLIPQLYNAERWGLDLGRWPQISRIRSACDEIEAFALAHPDLIGPPDDKPGLA